jgi:hypothetical protein
VTESKIRKICGESGGFSLIELIIVLMGATILMAAAIPGISRLQQEWNLWGGARMVEASLQWGRLHAVSANTPVLFSIEDDRTFCWVDPIGGDRYADSIRKIPAGLSIISSPKRPLRFYPHGNAAPAGTYGIKGSTGSYSVVGSPGGRIRVQKN